MLHLIVYCKDHKRRPIRIGPYPFFRDVQGQIPTHWCAVCGSEVFDQQQKCVRCRDRKEK